MSADRLPPIPPARWSAAQRREAEAVIAGPRGALLSPFVPLLRSPELMGHAQRMGEYLRYRSALGQRLSELAILLVARAWSQPVEWAIHAPIAAREGITPETIAAIGAGRRPPAPAGRRCAPDGGSPRGRPRPARPTCASRSRPAVSSARPGSRVSAVPSRR